MTTFFSNLFTSTNTSPEAVDLALEGVNVMVTPEINQMLLKPYSKAEVHKALSQMAPCKAPGPDGLHAIFYQRFWSVVGDDVSKFINDIIAGRVSP